MDPILLALNAPSGSLAAALLAAALLVTALIGTALLIARASRTRSVEAARQSAHAEEIEARMAELARIPADTPGPTPNPGQAPGGPPAGAPPTAAGPPPS